jgi:hypothetical protein
MKVREGQRVRIVEHVALNGNPLNGQVGQLVKVHRRALRPDLYEVKLETSTVMVRRVRPVKD